MSWKSQPRPSFTHVSTHQTHVGKALYEHAPDCATIAAVACMSSSLLKSSLGPNLLALIRVDDDDTFDLFDKIFLEYNPHMQLTQKLDVMFQKLDDSNELIEKLKSNGPLFSPSLQQAQINLQCLPLLAGFRALRSLTLANTTQSSYLPCLKSLPSLSELTLINGSFDAPFFKAMGDLENNRNLTSLTIHDFSERGWCSEGFQKDFCGRLLSKNRLAKLNWTLWNRMNGTDNKAIVNARMSNLLELRNSIPVKLIRGEGFGNLRMLSVTANSDEDLVNIGNHCLFLEVLKIGSTWVSRSLENEKNLVEDAFNQLRALDLGPASFSDSDVGTLFAGLMSFEKLSMKAYGNIDGSFLQHLPNPDRLRTIVLENDKFSVINLRRFVNLEVIEFFHVQLSREDILSFSVFKKLKRISLAYCGEHVASSEPFRILCPQLPNLEKLSCFGSEETKWTEEDVEAILIGCKRLRRLEFRLEGDDEYNSMDCKRIVDIKKKYPLVAMEGVLQKNEAAKQESGSRRKREE